MKSLRLGIKTSVKKMTEVLTKKNYDKVWPIIKYLDKNGKITPQAAEMVIKKSKSTTYRYLTMLVDTGYVEVSGNTNNAVYKLSVDNSYKFVR